MADVGKMREFRRELSNEGLKMRGVDYGVTVGASLYINGAMWFEVVVTPYVFTRIECEIG